MKNATTSRYLILVCALFLMPVTAWAVYGNANGSALELKTNGGELLSGQTLQIFDADANQVGEVETDEEGKLCVVREDQATAEDRERKPACIFLPADGKYLIVIGDERFHFSLVDGKPHVSPLNTISSTGKIAIITIPLVAIGLSNSGDDDNSTPSSMSAPDPVTPTATATPFNATGIFTSCNLVSGDQFLFNNFLKRQGTFNFQSNGNASLTGTQANINMSGSANPNHSFNISGTVFVNNVGTLPSSATGYYSPTTIDIQFNTVGPIGAATISRCIGTMSQ